MKGLGQLSRHSELAKANRHLTGLAVIRNSETSTA